jgi:hypothetical protein
MTTSGPDSSGGAGFRVADEQQLGENDQRLVEVRSQLVSLGEGQLLGVDDFVWGQAAVIQYENIQDQVIIVPGAERHQTPTERIYLMSPYRPGDDQVHGLAIQLYERDNEQVTDHFRLHIADPGRHPIVGMAIDETSNEAESIVHSEIDLTGLPQDARSYWSCVMTCLRDAWDQLPWPIRVLCGGACGSCIFSGNPYGCAACAGCLGGYAAGCLARCA